MLDGIVPEGRTHMRPRSAPACSSAGDVVHGCCHTWSEDDLGAEGGQGERILVQIRAHWRGMSPAKAASVHLEQVNVERLCVALDSLPHAVALPVPPPSHRILRRLPECPPQINQRRAFRWVVFWTAQRRAVVRGTSASRAELKENEQRDYDGTPEAGR